MGRATTATGKVWQGSNWIRKAKRLAIYASAGYVCSYCDCDVSVGNERGLASEHGTRLATLDHATPRSMGGSNGIENVLVSCVDCNRAKGDETLPSYLARTSQGRERLALLIAMLRGEVHA